MAYVIVFDVLTTVNAVIICIITAIYAQQVVYTLLGLFVKKKYYEAKRNHRYAVLIAARNEAAVIANLIESVKRQNYPAELLDVFVVADNCTDDTAAVARAAGAVVYERENRDEVGKGYALDHLIRAVFRDFSEKDYEAFFFFDADNLLDENYVYEMNKVFDSGVEIATSYRNAKNFGDNWISSGHGIFFLRENRYVHAARDYMDLSTYVAGTGFYASAKIFKSEGGWKYHRLIDDIDFTLAQVAKGKRVGYSDDAVFYDEQPVTMRDSWNQRIRWVKGQYECFAAYTKKLLTRSVKRKEYSSYDLATHVFPAHVIAITWAVLFHLAILIMGLVVYPYDTSVLYSSLYFLISSLLFVAAALIGIGLLVVCKEWKRIKAPAWRKVWSVFTFPFFMCTYIPVVYHALLHRVKWKPIAHSRSLSANEMNEKK